ncbi:hypothetical protein ACFV2V_13870 [Streptomyces sp. NPDC059698]|uniref:hypothetical protein n=1 Tax=unclassified Streptomyces TaxID=2593676 RepID=UPI00093D541E|nr:hypothetical protein [Streptomyces sp. CB02366]OKJ38267.1 hypothetical protein AMK24_11500 [Streptomyces sp. CB02366]
MAARKSTPPAPEPPEPDVVDEDQVEAEERPAPTAVEVAYVEALRREREGYTRYGREDRVAAVEAELKRLGAPLERAVTRPPETA